MALPHTVPGGEYPPVTEETAPPSQDPPQISAGAGHRHPGSDTHFGHSHEHMSVCTHTDIHTPTCTHMGTGTQRHSHTQTHTQTFTHTHAHTWAHTHTDIHTRAHRHSHTDTDTDTHTDTSWDLTVWKANWENRNFFDHLAKQGPINRQPISASEHNPHPLLWNIRIGIALPQAGVSLEPHWKGLQDSTAQHGEELSRCP